MERDAILTSPWIMLKQRILRLEHMVFGASVVPVNLKTTQTYLKQNNNWIQQDSVPNWIQKMLENKNYKQELLSTYQPWKLIFTSSSLTESCLIFVYENFIKATRTVMNDLENSNELYYIYGDNGFPLQANPLFRTPPRPL